jgi:hypothetical protein
VPGPLSTGTSRDTIREIERLRKSHVIAYLTTLRPNLVGLIADDAVRHFFDHIGTLPKRPVDRLDIFLVSNGGSGTVPWRLVSLLREYTKHLGVIIPYRAYSAATLLALGADEILMHPFAEIGPIDPTVSNDFNPSDENTKQKIGISVEDVKAYVTFIKETVGITHEDELVQAIGILADKVHPLALGNVERFLSQSRLIARKILRTHMKDADEHMIQEIVENLASKLYFHGHPINRLEARTDLRLKVVPDLAPPLEHAIWKLYLQYEAQFQNQEMFNPAGDLLAKESLALWAKPPVVLEQSYDLLHAVVESANLRCENRSGRRYRFIRVPPNPPAISEDVLTQGWVCTPFIQTKGSRRPRSTPPPGGVPSGPGASPGSAVSSGPPPTEGNDNSRPA